MNLSEFAAKHDGVHRLCRRHFEYEVPVHVPKTDHGGNKSIFGGMVYSRAMDHSKLGLTPIGANRAMKQGRLLAEMNLIPSVIISGIDQRNYDGARFTVAGISEVTSQSVPFCPSPAVTYPYYFDPFETAEATDEFGDAVPHKCINDTLRLWTESSQVFEARIMSAVQGKCRWEDPILFDLNFEAIVLLYYRLLKGVELYQIPDDGWCPNYGDFIVTAADGAVALFNAELELIEQN